jgi:diaminopimelate decarboxylase
MDHFTHKDGQLFAEDVAIKDIASSIGTPFYCYSTATLKRHYNVIADIFKDINSTICYAVKANSNLAVLKTLANLGSGADTVSEGEIRRALKAGIPSGKIVFSGVGKIRSEMRFALEQNIMQFNVESEAELEMLNEVAGELGKKAPIAFRVNPDVDANTHTKIATGRKTDKFGIAWDKAKEIYQKAASLENIEVVAISTHIGSQLTDLNPFKQAFEKLAHLTQELKAAGHNIQRVDFGGGLGVPYINETPPHPEEYAKLIVEIVKDLGCELMIEPGRVIAGNAGILVGSVISVKKTDDKNFVIIDAAMNDLMRPALYDAEHDVVAVEKAPNSLKADIVGPVCETGDVLAHDRDFPELIEGNLVAFRTAGAYGATMSNSYNTRPLVPEVLVNGNEFAVVRKRPTYEEIFSMEETPDWV